MSEDQVVNRRQMLKDAAIELISQHGYDRTSIKEIAKRCDVTVGVIYHYFSSKEELFDEALRGYCSEWESIIPMVKQLPLEEGLVFIASRLIDKWRKQQNFMVILVGECVKNPAVHEIFSRMLVEAREALGKYVEMKMETKELSRANTQIILNIFVSHFLTSFIHKEQLQIPIVPELNEEFIRSSVRTMLDGWRGQVETE
ncbi:UNVERIFIED_CONTAM: AcrR family transcriptional regulator [Brevibacillus sp. OAP136]